MILVAVLGMAALSCWWGHAPRLSFLGQKGVSAGAVLSLAQQRLAHTEPWFQVRVLHTSTQGTQLTTDIFQPVSLFSSFLGGS